MSPKMNNAPSSISYNCLVDRLALELGVKFEFECFPLLTVAMAQLKNELYLRVVRDAERGVVVILYDEDNKNILNYWVYPVIDITDIILDIKSGGH